MQSLAICARFLGTLADERRRSPDTCRAYKSDLNDFLRFLGNRQFHETSQEDLRAYVASMTGRGLKVRTVRRRIACLRSLYGFMKDEGLLTHSPTAGYVLRLPRERRLPKVMSQEQATILLACASRSALSQSGTKRAKALRSRSWAMLELLFATGMRTCELVRLNLSDLELERRIVRIQGKGDRQRDVYLSSDETIEAIKAYLGRRETLRPQSAAIFASRSGARLGTQTVRSTFRSIAREAGIPSRFTAHCLRHSLATQLIENGADVRSVQEILGHSSIVTTQIYLEVSANRKAEEVMTRYNPRNRFSVRAATADN